MHVTIEFLHLDGCPNSALAEQRPRTALALSGREDVVVDRVEVTGLADADRLGFIGSPSVRVNGQDPFATGEEQVGFACRVYAGPEGLCGSPTVEQFIEVLA